MYISSLYQALHQKSFLDGFLWSKWVYVVSKNRQNEIKKSSLICKVSLPTGLLVQSRLYHMKALYTQELVDIHPAF
jgi:hypothetical protein